MVKIAVLDDYQDIALKLADWTALPKDTDIRVFRDHLPYGDALVDRLQDYPIISSMRERTPFPRELFARLPNLKLLVTTGLFNAAIDLPAATERGVVVCGTGAPPKPGTKISLSNVYELAWGLIIACARHLPQEDAAIRQGRWQETVGITLEGKTLGLLGLGNLGSQMAAIAHVFNMPTIAWSQNLTRERADQFNTTLVTKDELFRNSDIISIHLKLSDRTTHLVGLRELKLMKPTAYIVNTSRGPIIDEKALIQVLQDRTIGGAGLDVFDEEPLPQGHPFLKLDNVVMTPHLGYVTIEAYRPFFKEIVENIQAYLDGRPIRVMNPAVLEKK